jgi:methylase of polypeptide subunit release factors
MSMGGTIARCAYEDLARSFERNDVFGYMHPYELYRKWLEAVWAFMDAVHDPDGYRLCLDRYTREQGEEFGRLMGLYVDAVEAEPFRDILGRLFMCLDVKSAAAGQYFTPWGIAEAMARMQFDRDDFERLVREKGEVTVCDPAVGSGVMLLAFASVVHEALGRWGTGKLRLYGTDIDVRCVNMCRIQLRMNGLDEFGRMVGMLGVIQQGLPPDAAILKPGRQLQLPGMAA